MQRMHLPKSRRARKMVSSQLGLTYCTPNKVPIPYLVNKIKSSPCPLRKMPVYSVIKQFPKVTYITSISHLLNLTKYNTVEFKLLILLYQEISLSEECLPFVCCLALKEAEPPIIINTNMTGRLIILPLLYVGPPSALLYPTGHLLYSR